MYNIVPYWSSLHCLCIVPALVRLRDVGRDGKPVARRLVCRLVSWGFGSSGRRAHRDSLVTSEYGDPGVASVELPLRTT